MTNTISFDIISTDSLDTIHGGIDRSTYQSIGKNGAEIGVLAGGAAAGTYAGGPAGAAAGTAGAEVLNRTGLPGRVGSAVGGAVWDAGSAMGEGAYNAYSWVRNKVTGR
ncbi:MAG: hypothetical protein AB7T06_38185 [Kofleriaceae bacterium]